MPPFKTLPRRAFLGAHLGDDATTFGGDGILVDDVVGDGMAERAGMAAGDRLLQLAGLPVGSLVELRTALRKAGADDQAEIVYAHNGKQTCKRVDVRPHPLETIANQQVFYGQLDRDDIRVRTISTMPTQGPLRGAIMVVQGIARESVDYGCGFDQPLAQLVLGWARAGYATLRVDKRGVGDSEGGPCSELDFVTELSDVSAAFSLLVHEARSARIPLFVFGHSVGGMMATQLAAQTHLDGVMVFGTSTAKWLDCIAASTERQLRMRGVSDAHIATHLRELRAGVVDNGLNGRTPTYHQQLQQIDLEDAWRQAQVGAALVMRGEHDWVVSAEEQARIATVVGSTRATVVDLPGLDHVLGWHPDREHSMNDYGAGRTDTAIVDTTLRWMASVSA